MMLFRLYLGAILLSALGIVAFFILGLMVPSWFDDVGMAGELGVMATRAATYVAGSCFLLAMLFATYSSYRYWKWANGEAESCFQCGGIAAYKEGKYGLGPYYHCLKCGKNRSIK